ncbi:MAG: hypothetical protein EA406_11670 [Rhodospirillales bacterium]|nr:MAG: hypothetical protein EA406_11670 [Rhodospirillales bacterium]
MPKDFSQTEMDDQVLLSEAGTARCRWIISRRRFGQFVICGERVRIGSSYCDQHHERVWRPTHDGRRRGS